MVVRAALACGAMFPSRSVFHLQAYGIKSIVTLSLCHKAEGKGGSHGGWPTRRRPAGRTAGDRAVGPDQAVPQGQGLAHRGQRRHPQRAAGPGDRAAGAERRGQDHHDQDDRQPGAAHRGRGQPERARCGQPAAGCDAADRRGSGGLPQRVLAADRLAEPDVLRAAQGPARRRDPAPCREPARRSRLVGAAERDRRVLLTGHAAEGRDRGRAGYRPADPAAGRADDRPGRGGRPHGQGLDRPPGRRRGQDDPADHPPAGDRPGTGQPDRGHPRREDHRRPAHARAAGPLRRGPVRGAGAHHAQRVPQPAPAGKPGRVRGRGHPDPAPGRRPGRAAQGPGRAAGRGNPAALGQPGPAGPGGDLPPADPPRQRGRPRSGRSRSHPLRRRGACPMTAVTVPRAGTPGLALRAVANETDKGLALLWRRKATLVMATATGGVMYLMIQFFIGGGHVNHAVLAVTLPALAAGYGFASTAALAGAGGIAEEVNGGTLEQSHLSPARPSLLALGRLAALAAEGLIPATVLAVAFGLGYGPHWVIRPDALVPLILTITDALGYALLMTALTLRVASIGAVVHVFNMAVMFFGGMFIPIILFPHGLEIFARFIPTALGVEVLNTALAGHGLGAAWADGTLPWLLVHVVALAGLGWITYLCTVRRARREGGLSP